MNGAPVAKAVLIIPALNEEPAIGVTLGRVPGGMYAEIIVSDNGSGDRTAEIAAYIQRRGKRRRRRCMQHEAMAIAAIAQHEIDGGQRQQRRGPQLVVKFEHEAVASVLLERSIALDSELGRHVDGSRGRIAFIKHLIEQRSHYFAHGTPAGPWQLFLTQQVMRALDDVDLPAFVSGLQREPSLLGDACVEFQAELRE